MSRAVAASELFRLVAAPSTTAGCADMFVQSVLRGWNIRVAGRAVGSGTRRLVEAAVARVPPNDLLDVRVVRIAADLVTVGVVVEVNFVGGVVDVETELSEGFRWWRWDSGVFALRSYVGFGERTG